MEVAEILFSILIIAFGLVTIIDSRRFVYWYELGLGPGFVPFWLGLTLTVAAFYSFVTVVKKRPSLSRGFGLSRTSLYKMGLFLVLLVVSLLVMPYIGWNASMTLFLVISLVYIENVDWRRSLLVAVGSQAFIFLIFRVWLGVWLPTGPLGL